MASINYHTREISCKIVYYGPGLSGKTTNLQIIHKKVPKDSKSEMVSLATETDRTLFFDFLPLDLGSIKGFSTKFQLYTVPGQVYYNATRKLVLRGVDGVVFVADSQRDKMPENLESLRNLEENLREYGIELKTTPFVLQYNKRDLPSIFTVEEMNAQINSYGVPCYEAQAHQGVGVFTTLKAIGKVVIDTFNAKYSARQTSRRPEAAPSSMAASPSVAPIPSVAPVIPPPPAPTAMRMPPPLMQAPPPPPPPPVRMAAPPAAPTPIMAPPIPVMAPVPPPAPLPPPAVQNAFVTGYGMDTPVTPSAAPSPAVATYGFAPPPQAAPVEAVAGLQSGFFQPPPPANQAPASFMLQPPAVGQPLASAPSNGSGATRKGRLDGTMDPRDLDEEIARMERELQGHQPPPAAAPIQTNPNVNPNMDTDPAFTSAFLSPDEIRQFQKSPQDYPTQRLPMNPGGGQN
jgi:signal recognition particle receptor subunit beta